MKGLIAFVVFSFALVAVHTSPVNRVEADVSETDWERVRDGVEKLVKIAKFLEEHEVEIPRDINIPRMQNVISAPIYCDDGFKYYLGKCRKVVFTVPGLIRRPPSPASFNSAQ